MLQLVPHLVTQRSARLWLCARGVDETQLDSVELEVNGVDVPVPRRGWRRFPSKALPLHYQFIDKPTLTPERSYDATVQLAGDQQAHARFTTLPEQLGDETKPLRVLLSSCYFTGNKWSRLAATLLSRLERNGLRPHLRIWAGDQVYLDAPWYEFMVKAHSVSELERLHSDAYARTWQERNIVDLLAQIVAWLGYCWAVGGSSNPLTHGHGIPSATLVERAHGLAGIDLSPGLPSASSCPEAIWQAARWWYEAYDAVEASSKSKQEAAFTPRGAYLIRQPAAAAAGIRDDIQGEQIVRSSRGDELIEGLRRREPESSARAKDKKARRSRKN